MRKFFLLFSISAADFWQFKAVFLQQILKTSVFSASITMQIRIY